MQNFKTLELRFDGYLNFTSLYLHFNLLTGKTVSQVLFHAVIYLSPRLHLCQVLFST